MASTFGAADQQPLSSRVAAGFSGWKSGGQVMHSGATMGWGAKSEALRSAFQSSAVLR